MLHDDERTVGMRLAEERLFIKQVQEGQQEAYAQLVTRHQQMIYRVCFQLCKNHTVAEDLTQDTFLKAYESIHQFRGDASFSTWLYQIATRLCLNWRRRQGIERQRAASEAEVTLSNMPSHGSVEHDVIDRFQQQAIHSLVQSLNHPYQEVVELFYFQGWSYEEIAQSLGISVKTVESRLYRARNILREQGGVLI
ncbi:RNA polymerase sigma factor [Alicyclobacillus dauci]|uniref:RNA polymerase sigma factor n=1 Tax=Alicyclobacillus dauci TaxID=1475485 RepID=A0ABY6YZH0_9BACL|nr:RNA polymerase sigma factor [Alicyclobacillus dauci]WAH35905.1 RNA polymerase sigma factor [Alicyclobacillus dauci]